MNSFSFMHHNSLKLGGTIQVGIIQVGNSSIQSFFRCRCSRAVNMRHRRVKLLFN